MQLLFDIGGTYTRLAVSANGKTFGKHVKFRTPKNFNEGIRTIKGFSRELAHGKKITRAAGGIAGPLDARKEKLANSPHLPGWIGKPLKHELLRITAGKVTIENDTAVAGLGEAVFGAGCNYRIVAYITVSTGVNGVRVVEGMIDTSAFGFEIGHQIVAQKNSRPQTLESLIGGGALTKKYKKWPSEITDKAVWRGVVRNLAHGIANTILYWSPEVVVLGGSVAMLVKPFKGELLGTLKKTVTIFPKFPVVTFSKLKDVGGLYGALALLKV